MDEGGPSHLIGVALPDDLACDREPLEDGAVSEA